jgi:hypothetical protein
MKFKENRPLADLELAARKLLEIANSVEAVQDGRIHIEKINWPFLQELAERSRRPGGNFLQRLLTWASLTKASTRPASVLCETGGWLRRLRHRRFDLTAPCVSVERTHAYRDRSRNSRIRRSHSAWGLS